MYAEGPESFILYNGRKLLIDDLIKACESLEVMCMSTYFLYRFGTGDNKTFDQARVDQADLNIPVIVLTTEVEVLLLDGMHRLVKAIQQHENTIKIYMLDKETVLSLLK